jgi:hypothetical protein
MLSNGDTGAGMGVRLNAAWVLPTPLPPMQVAGSQKGTSCRVRKLFYQNGPYYVRFCEETRDKPAAN